MTDYEKVHTARRALEALRADLAARLPLEDDHKPDLLKLHDRVSKAIYALSA